MTLKTTCFRCMFYMPHLGIPWNHPTARGDAGLAASVGDMAGYFLWLLKATPTAPLGSATVMLGFAMSGGSWDWGFFDVWSKAVFSRMRSEGFPFIVGVWGWTCVRVVLVVSSSCRRRCVVNFSPLGGTHALRHNPFLQSMKSGGSLARNARFGTSNFQGERSFSHFAWQAQDFGSFLLEKLKKPRTKCSFWKLVALKVEVLEASVVLCSTA